MNEKVIKIKAAALSCFLDHTVLFYEKNNETIIAQTKNYNAPLLDNSDNSAIFLGESSGYAFNLLSASYEFDDMPTNLPKKLKEEYDKLFPVLEKHKEKLPLIIKPPYKGFSAEQFYDGEYYNDLLTHRVVCENKTYKNNLMKYDAVDIISNSYKTVIYDEIEDIFSDADSVLSEDQAKFLCERNNILDFIYEEWITNSIISSTREDLITTILGLRRNMTEYEVKSIINGCAYLEATGDLYEYIGNDENNLMIFQCITDDYYFKTTYDDLISNNRFNLYKKQS